MGGDTAKLMMKRMLVVVLLSSLLTVGLVAPQPAAAQCVYTAQWDFAASVPTEWAALRVAWDGVDGYQAAGAAHFNGTANSIWSALYTDELVAALGLPAGATIVADGITVDAAIKFGAGSSASVAISGSGYDYAASGNTSWTVVSVVGSPGTLSSINLSVVAGGSGSAPLSAKFDDVAISVPCESVTLPSTPTPTPTLTPTPEAPPTATPDPIATLSAGPFITTSVEFLTPYEIPPLADVELDIWRFWEISNYQNMLRVTITHFYLENVPRFLKILIFVMAVTTGIRLILALIGVNPRYREEKEFREAQRAREIAQRDELGGQWWKNIDPRVGRR